VAQQADRVKQGRNRPLLSNNVDIVQKLEDLMRQRDALYREIADFVVSTDHRKVLTVAQEILRELDRAKIPSLLPPLA